MTSDFIMTSYFRLHDVIWQNYGNFRIQRLELRLSLVTFGRKIKFFNFQSLGPLLGLTHAKS